MDNINMGFMVFATGAAGYTLIEYVFRGHTHWSMALTGGACLLVFYWFAKEVGGGLSIPLRAAAGACICTVFEFFVGLLVNLRFGWNVWDYSHLTGNVLGQICPKYTLFWFSICLAISLAADAIRLLKETVERRNNRLAGHGRR